MNPNQPKAYFLAAQDAFTEEFHEVSTEIFRAVYRGQHDPMFLSPLCVVVNPNTAKAVLFVPSGYTGVDDETFKKFTAWVNHVLSRIGGIEKAMCVVMEKPPLDPTMQGIDFNPMVSEETKKAAAEYKQRLMQDFLKNMEAIKEAWDKAKEEERKKNDPQYGELGYNDWFDSNGNDQWFGTNS
jgi:hypothetical protein